MQSSPVHRERLRAFETLLAARGFPTGFAAQGEQVPYDVLLVGVSDADETRQWQLELSFIPGMEENLDGAALLQCFAPLAGEVPPAAEDGLLRLIARLNAKLPIIGFGWLNAERMACFRHVAVLPRDDEAASELVEQAVWLTAYLLSVFAAAVEDVASGARSFDEALRGNVFRDVFES
jgi:hypothetical protein